MLGLILLGQLIACAGMDEALAVFKDGDPLERIADDPGFIYQDQVGIFYHQFDEMCIRDRDARFSGLHVALAHQLFPDLHRIWYAGDLQLCLQLFKIADLFLTKGNLLFQDALCLSLIHI